MKACKANLLQFLGKAGHLEVPVYQRCYSWTNKQCQQLWDDLVSLAKNENINSHFLGVIVYVEKDLSQISSVNTSYLIDGQQRLTAVALILAALVHILDESGQKNELTARKIKNRFLYNHELYNSDEDKQRYKLRLNSDDNSTYKAVLDGHEDLPLKYSQNILDSYELFKKLISESQIPHNQIFSALQKLEIIDVALQKGFDNPQLIFDSLNSTGVRLSQNDQIRNYVLMGLEQGEQNELYKNYWEPMEKAFFLTNKPELFEQFMRDYLTIQNNGQIPAISEIYSGFNTFFNARLKLQSRKEILKHLYRYSGYFLKIVFCNINAPEISEIVKRINSLNAKDSYPFIMEVFEDFENGLIDENILAEILKTVESFIVKRITNPDDKIISTFATLSNDINKMLALKDFTPKIVEPEAGIFTEVPKSTINKLLRVNE